MPHFPKPFYRKSRSLWYVQLNGKQVNLGSDQDEAFQRYHELLATPAKQEVEISTSEDSTLVVSLCDKFLGWTEKHRAEDTYEWYRRLLQQFVSLHPDLSVARLKPFHVQQWIDELDVKQTSKRNCVRAIKRAMRWSKKQGYIDVNPIAEMEAPSSERREYVIAEDEFKQILDAIPNQEFRDLVLVSWETGCRPQESLRVEVIFPQS